MNKVRYLLGRYAGAYTDFSAYSYWGAEEIPKGRTAYLLKRLLRKGIAPEFLAELNALCDYEPETAGSVTEEDICVECDKIMEALA